MNKILAGSVLCLASLLHAAPGCGGHGTRETMLVSTAWLSAHLNHADVVALAVGRPSPAKLRSAANARPWIALWPVSHSLADVFGNLGVSNASHVILYVSNDALSLTTRPLKFPNTNEEAA